MTESAQQRIHKAVKQLQIPDRVAIACTVLVRPADLADDYLCEGEVIDRWTVAEHTDGYVTVECLIESHSKHGQDQYAGIQSAIAGVDDLLPNPHGKNATHLLIEQLFSDSAELTGKMELARRREMGQEMEGPHLFFRLPRMLEKTARETPPDFSSSKEWAHLLSWLYEQGVTPDGRNMMAFLSAFKRYTTKFRGTTNCDGRLTRIPAPDDYKSIRSLMLKTMKEQNTIHKHG